MMSANTVIIGGHGIGDCMMALQCATITASFGHKTDVIMAVRDEVYRPLQYLFGTEFTLKQEDESYAANNYILINEEIFNRMTEGYDNRYYVLPDLLFNNKYAFDCDRFGTTPQLVREIRLLKHPLPSTRKIYLGLMSTTPGYQHPDPMRVAIELAHALPSCQIYFPIVEKWARKVIKPIYIPNILPTNLCIDRNPDMIASLKELEKSSYFVGTDNGPSHIAYHLGIPRLLLDPQFQRLPWIARWRENFLESIPIDTPAPDIARVVHTNLSIPQTTLVPRMTCLVNRGEDWSKLLLMKTH